MVLGLTLVVLLPPALADSRVRREVDTGDRALRPGPPGSGDRPDLAVLVELRGLLSEVPDVPCGVLRVPIGRALLELAFEVEVVLDDLAADAIDHRRLVHDANHVARPLAVLDAAIDQRGSRLQREPCVVHARDVADAGRVARNVRGAPGPTARTAPAQQSEQGWDDEQFLHLEPPSWFVRRPYGGRMNTR